jgi:hypothetical protein
MAVGRTLFNKPCFALEGSYLHPSAVLICVTICHCHFGIGQKAALPRQRTNMHLLKVQTTHG